MSVTPPMGNKALTTSDFVEIPKASKIMKVARRLLVVGVGLVGTGGAGLLFRLPPGMVLSMMLIPGTGYAILSHTPIPNKVKELVFAQVKEEIGELAEKGEQ